MQLQTERPEGNVQGKGGWCVPPHDVLKISIDGAFCEEKTGAWVVVVRDNDGHGVLAGARHLRVHCMMHCLLEIKLAWQLYGWPLRLGSLDSLLRRAHQFLLWRSKPVTMIMGQGGVVFKEIHTYASFYQCIISFQRVLFTFLVLVIGVLMS